MRRREFITLLGSAAATWPLAARAQPAGKIWRIGVVTGGVRPDSLESSPEGGFPQGMRELGYVEGKDFVIEWRFADGINERYPEIAADLLRLRVDILVVANSRAVQAIGRVTSTVPIVMVGATDPVGSGLVMSLARPGGNITGLATSQQDVAPKQLDLLATAIPNLSRIAVLLNPDAPAQNSSFMQSLQPTAQKAKIAVLPVEASNRQEIDQAFAVMARERVGGVIVRIHPLFADRRHQIAQLALQHRLPSVFGNREYAEAGGLMGYGDSTREFRRRAAAFVDKIIKGAKPADLPVEQPTRFNFVINRKTADALGLSLPAMLYIFADDVIE
jgi:putative ABC transport system substrate-binding protein